MNLEHEIKRILGDRNCDQLNWDRISAFSMDTPVEKKIKSYRHMDGWYFGKGKAPSIFTITMATAISRYARKEGLSVDSALIEAGEIQLALFSKLNKEIDEYLEVTLNSDNKYEILRFVKENDDWLEKEEFVLNKLSEVCEYIRHFEKRLSDGN